MIRTKYMKRWYVENILMSIHMFNYLAVPLGWIKISEKLQKLVFRGRPIWYCPFRENTDYRPEIFWRNFCFSIFVFFNFSCFSFFLLSGPHLSRDRLGTFSKKKLFLILDFFFNLFFQMSQHSNVLTEHGRSCVLRVARTCFQTFSKSIPTKWPRQQKNKRKKKK